MLVIILACKRISLLPLALLLLQCQRCHFKVTLTSSLPGITPQERVPSGYPPLPVEQVAPHPQMGKVEEALYLTCIRDIGYPLQTMRCKTTHWSLQCQSTMTVVSDTRIWHPWTPGCCLRSRKSTSDPAIPVWRILVSLRRLSPTRWPPGLCQFLPN